MPLRTFIYEETGSRRGYRSRYLCQLLGKTGDLTNPDHVESLSIPVRTEWALNYLRDNERFISTDDFSSLERFENDETLETQELQRLIHEAIFSLPPKCRDVFNKSRMDNLSNKEIAEQMNISVKAVEGHISRALKQIRAYLGDAYHYLW